MTAELRAVFGHVRRGRRAAARARLSVLHLSRVGGILKAAPAQSGRCALSCAFAVLLTFAIPGGAMAEDQYTTLDALLPKLDLLAPPPASMATYVQIGAYRDHDNALRAASTLRAGGLPPRIVPIGRKPDLYLVVIGPYTTGRDLTVELNKAISLGYEDAYLVPGARLPE